MVFKHFIFQFFCCFANDYVLQNINIISNIVLDINIFYNIDSRIGNIHIVSRIGNIHIVFDIDPLLDYRNIGIVIYYLHSYKYHI